MYENKLLDLSFEFAVAIVHSVDAVKAQKSSYLTDQLVRAGTFFTETFMKPNVHRAKRISLQSSRLRKRIRRNNLLVKADTQARRIEDRHYQNTEKLCGNIRRLLIASCKTGKENTK